MTFRLRIATEADVPELLPRSRALQLHENIEISDAELERALREMLADPTLGCVFMIEEDSVVAGYAFLSYSFDLEFAGREAWLTELYLDESAAAALTRSSCSSPSSERAACARITFRFARTIRRSGCTSARASRSCRA